MIAKFRVGGAEVDLPAGIVRASDGTVTGLRRQSREVLRLLVARRGEIVGKGAISDAVWGDIAVTEDSLVQCIADIRRALGDARDRLCTVKREGYRLEPEDSAPEVPMPEAPSAPSRRRLRNVLVLTAAMLMLIAFGWRAYGFREVPPPDRIGFDGPVVAVLPFENLSGGERWDRLARGMTQEVIADLAGNAWLFVLADATTRPHAAAAPQEIAATLGASYVIDGSLQADDGQVRVSASLLDASSGRQVWTKRWEGPAERLLAFQREASAMLAGEIGSRWSGPLSRTEMAKAKGRGPDDLSAYDLTLLAADRFSSWAPEDLDAGIALLERALQIDPDNADGWALLAWGYQNRLLPGSPPDEARRLAAAQDAAALEAYRLAPDRPKALIIAAQTIERSDRPRAEAMLRRAAAVAPNDADMLDFAGGIIATRFPAAAPEAEIWVRRAMALNPGYPPAYNYDLGNALMVQGRYAEAAAAYERGPDYIDLHMLAAACHALAGQPQEAKAALTRALHADPGLSIGWFREVFNWQPAVEDAVVRGLRLAGAPE